MRSAFKKKILYLLICLGVLIFISPFLLNLALNIPVSKNYIASYLNRFTTSTTHFDDFKVTLFPKPEIKIDQLTHFKNSEKPIISIQSGSVKLNLFALLSGKVVIDSILLVSPEIDEDQIPKGKKTPSIPAVFVENFQNLIFNFIDDYFPGSSEKLVVEIQNLSSPYFKDMNAFIGIYKSREKITLKLRANDIEIDNQLIGLPALKSSGFKSLYAKGLNLTATSAAAGKTTADISITGLVLKENTDQIGFTADKLKAALYQDHDILKIEVPDFSVKYPEMKFSSVLDFDKSKKKSIIRFNGRDINIDQARKSALKLIPSNEVTDHLFDIVLGGRCPEITVSFEGKGLADLFDENRMQLSGRINSGRVAIPETRLIATSVDGKAGVKNGVLSIKAGNGKIKSADILTGTLDIDLLNYEDIPFQGDFDLDVDLADLPETLISLLPETLLARELEKVTRLNGKSRARLILSMTTNSELSVRVKTAPFSARGFYERIPGPIVVNQMVFEVEPDSVRIKNGDGIVMNSHISGLNAEFFFEKELILSIQSGAAKVDLDPVLDFLNRFQTTRSMINPVSKGSGTLFIDKIFLFGDVLVPGKWKYKLDGTGTDIGIFTQARVEQLKNLEFSFHVEPGNFQFDKISFNAENFDWLKDFSASAYTDQIATPLFVEDGALILNPGKFVVNAKISNPSEVKADIKLEGKTRTDLSLKTLHISDGTLSDAVYDCTSEKNKFPCRFSGKLNTGSIEKLLDTESTWRKSIKKLTSGRQMIIQQIDDGQLNISTKRLDLNTLLKGKNNILEKEKLEFPELKVNFSADQLDYKKLKFKDVHSSIIFSQKGIYVKVDQADLCGLSPRGYINYENGWIYTNFPLAAKKDADASELLTCLLEKESFMDGIYSLTGKLSSSSHINDVGGSFKGKAGFEARNGRIYKLTLLSRILSVLNVLKVFEGKIPDITQTGFAYNSLMIECTVNESMINLDKAVLDGQDMTMIFSGTIDPVKDEIDVTCLVAPFKTVDMIIQKIPIINTLMGGRLVSVPVRASGKLSDPNVIPLHPSAVGKGLIDMMTTILKTPVTLIDKLSTEAEKQKVNQ